MIRRKEEIRGTRKQAPFQGKGDITVRELLEGPGEMYQKGRVFAHTTVHPGAAIGYHVHENESETYYILSGRAKLNHNGKGSGVPVEAVQAAGENVDVRV